MARKGETQSRKAGRFRRVADAVVGLFSRKAKGSRGEASTGAPATKTSSQRQTARAAAATPGRVTRREADIPLDVLDRAYTPANTSSKASFRSDGADHQQDQEYARGVADDRWNDEDRITNKSGDPRIGTHRRTYEPGEERPESRQ